jgi:hypothetical protein
VRLGYTSARVEEGDRVELHRTEHLVHVYVGDVVLFGDAGVMTEKLSAALTLCQKELGREPEAVA